MNYDGIYLLDSYKERYNSPMSDPEPGASIETSFLLWPEFFGFVSATLVILTGPFS
jgi:hypothetical protein